MSNQIDIEMNLGRAIAVFTGTAGDAPPRNPEVHPCPAIAFCPSPRSRPPPLP
jgi:hypothetical protein